MRTLLLLSAALLLVACTTPQQRAAQLQQEMEQNIAVYGPACTRLGFQANSDQWRTCIINLSTKDEMQRYSNYPGYYAGFGRGYWGGGGMWGPYW